MRPQLFLPVLVVSMSLRASEARVQMKDLPDPVRKTVMEQTQRGRLAQFPGQPAASLHGLSKEVENGKTFYEAETTQDGKAVDILIDASGAIVEIERSISLDAIPEAARSALERRAGSDKVLSVESVTKGATTSYEAVIQRNGRRSEVAVNADGSSKEQ